MEGILLINKESGVTSRDVVNQISKKLNTKKVGHAGTLDPLATGLLVVGVNKGTKILDLLTLDTKEYIAKVLIGVSTDTLDITGNVLNKNNNILLNKEDLINVLNSFKGSYYQTVPKYSAVKINGKKLYEYARNGEDIELPKRLVNIYEIELLDFKDNMFTFKVLVSKGTYIRSLIKDIGDKLNIYTTMYELVRTKSGNFNLEDAKLLQNISYNDLISIDKSLEYEKVVVSDLDLLKKIRNGNKIKYESNENKIIFLYTNKVIAIYQKDNDYFKAFKVF